MEGCPIHLSFDIRVSCSIIAIIFLIYSLVFGGGVPVAPGSWQPNNTSQTMARQSLCFLSWNTHVKSSKAGVWVQSLPIWLQNMGVVYSSLQPGIPEMNLRTLIAIMSWASGVLWFLLSAYKQSSMNCTSISSLV